MLTATPDRIRQAAAVLGDSRTEADQWERLIAAAEEMRDILFEMSLRDGCSCLRDCAPGVKDGCVWHQARALLARVGG